jgi:mono/diheme cytochrome c family protein
VVACGLLVLAAQPLAQDREEATIRRGDEVYQYWCATCHGAGPGHPGTAALAAKYKGARSGVLEERTDLTPAGIRLYVRNGVSIMPFFRKTEVSEADLEAIAAYLMRRR